jgi:Ser/Thr protein kinase RdoA (MazF antagonist)
VGLSDSAVRPIAAQFALAGQIVGTRPLAGGHINDSYRVDVRVRETKAVRSYLLQCVNAHVFPRPDLVMENVSRVTRHIAARIDAADPPDRERRVLTLVPTHRGHDWHTEPDGACWRTFAFIPGAVVRERAQGPRDAYAGGRAFGEFLRLLADYDGLPLHETIPDFHDTAAHFARLEAAIGADPCARAATAGAEIVGVLAERSLAAVLPPLLASGAVPPRIVHNDAKLANVLLDERTGEALCVVDLDTVMRGSALHDFGDMVRSMTSPTAEDEDDRSRVGVRLPMFEAIVRGYLGAAGALLTAAERELLGLAGRLITLEQAVRFLTDHLVGDRYYRIERPGQNLARCRTQLALLHSLTLHAAELDTIVARQIG